MEDTSVYECDCGKVFDLRFAREYGFNLYYKGRCPNCKREIYEWRKNPNYKKEKAE